MTNPKTPNTPNGPYSPKVGRPGYEHLTCYQLGVVLQELTEQFTNKWIKSPRRRMQMDEAARSIPANIAEGFTQESLKGYIYLSGIARGSNEELGKDYVNFLKTEKLAVWPKDDLRIRGFREFRVKWKSQTAPNTPALPAVPERAANMVLTFSQMEGFLLKKLIFSLRNKHKTEGGLTENLYKERRAFRGY